MRPCPRNLRTRTYRLFAGSHGLRARTPGLLATAWLAAALALASPCPAAAGDWKVVQDDDGCDDGHHDDRSHCEVREIRLSARDLVSVDAGKNGGIRVDAWDENEILVRAQVQVWKADPDDVDGILREIEIRTDDDILATGPSRRGRMSWSVSYRILVPRKTDLSLEAVNGGITIVGVTGEIDFQTTNGGIRVADLGGDVLGRTQNGGIDVRLSGNRWQGEGSLDLETRNGGIELEIPEDYSADLELETVNGGIRSDIPLRGEGRKSRRIRTELGEGGPLVRILTTNGGISIRES